MEFGGYRGGREGVEGAEGTIRLEFFFLTIRLVLGGSQILRGVAPILCIPILFNFVHLYIVVAMNDNDRLFDPTQWHTAEYAGYRWRVYHKSI